MNLTKVLKSFDIFNSEAVRFFKQAAVNIFLIETNNKKQNAVNIDSTQNALNVNIINRPKTYKLLVSAQKRLEEKKLAKVQK